MFRLLRTIALMIPVLVVGQSQASETTFERSRFDSLQKQGKPTLVSILADWCPTCKAQRSIIADLLKTPELQAITAMRVDFDSQKSEAQRFKAKYQSTLIVFKGGKEVGRSAGDSNKENIAALLKKAI